MKACGVPKGQTPFYFLFNTKSFKKKGCMSPQASLNTLHSYIYIYIYYKLIIFFLVQLLSHQNFQQQKYHPIISGLVNIVRITSPLFIHEKAIWKGSHNPNPKPYGKPPAPPGLHGRLLHHIPRTENTIDAAGILSSDVAKGSSYRGNPRFLHF